MRTSNDFRLYIFVKVYKHENFQKHPPEVFYKSVFLKISQNLQKNICARVSFLIKLQASDSGTSVFL